LFPNLTDRDWQWGGEAAQLEQTITAGRQAVMPPWQAVLGDAGVAQVADYVASLADAENGTGENAASEGTNLEEQAPVTAEETQLESERGQQEE
jgi:mono/diheme cytochrome c family protein